MTVDDVMTPEPVCCTPETGLREVSLMMLEHDCGEIPIVQNADERTLVGVVTDRDIVCRLVAHGQNPVELTAEACMSHPVVSVAAGSSLDECCEIMGSRQIRRMPVVDANGAICGIVSQADIAQFTSVGRTAEVVREVSEPARTNGQWPEPTGEPVVTRRAPAGDRSAG